MVMNETNSRLIYGFVGVIIGIVFLMSIADTTSLQTDLQTRYNESINIASTRLVGGQINGSINLSVAKNQGVTGQTPISGFVLLNSTGGVISSGGNYSFDSTYGNLTLINSSFWTTGGGSKSNITLGNYQYKDNNYVEDAPSRSIVTLIIILGAIGIVLFIIAKSEVGSNKIFKLRK